jgi:hypothetical protein
MSNGDDDQSTTWYPSASPAPRAEPVEPPAAPGTPAPASNWDQILQNAAPKYTGQPGGTTTVFATLKDLADWEKHHSVETGDNGVGSAALGGVDTAHSYGVAVPKEIMRNLYGGRASDPSTTANWRTALAQVTINGKTYVVPISDLGPGAFQQTEKGGNRLTDLTSDLAKGIPGWMSDDSDGPAQVKLLPPGSGPDYLKDRAGWHAEQQKIGKQLTPTPLGSTDIVRPPQPPRAEPVLSTAQADEPEDTSDPMYHWPEGLV